jgi:tape measure domain-containing protein
MSDRLVIEIDGNASGLTKALSQAQGRLNTFNTAVGSGNKAINSFISNLNKGASAVTRLSGSVNALKASFSGLRSQITSTGNAIDRLGNQARTSAGSLAAFSSAMGNATRRVEGFSASTRGAQSSVTSLGRRIAALGATVTALNANMRSLNRTTLSAATGLSSTGRAAAGAGTALRGAGVGASGAAVGFNRLHRANLGLGEGFRRTVAQITALRTLTYQAIFWFSPLIYGIIKTNAAYEKQMQLLRNLSGQTTALAKQQWAEETRKQLITLANTNPFSLNQITETFVRLKVSGIDPLNGSMQSLMDSIAAFGGGNDELQRAAIAVQQMVGKSAVSMEELRQQIGEHIPDAMKSMAIGMGLSMADFYKAVQKGTVESVSALHNMFLVLNAEHRGAALSMMNTWNGLIARLGTAWQNFVAKITTGQGGNSFIAQLKKDVQELLIFLNTPAGINFGIEVQNALAAVAKGVEKVIHFIYEWRQAIIDVAKVLMLMWGGRLVLGTIGAVVSAVFGLVKAFAAVNLIIGIFRGTVTAASAATKIFGANTLAAAAATRVLSGATGTASNGLAMLAARFGAAGVAAAGLAGYIWLVVKALNAKSIAEQNTAMVERANQGGTFKDDAERQSERARLNAIRERIQKGGTTVMRGDGPYFKKDTPQQRAYLTQQYSRGAKTFNVMNGMFNRTSDTSAVMAFSQDIGSVDPYAGTRAKYAALKAATTDGKKLKDLQTKENAELAQNAQGRLNELLAERKKTTNPNKQKALDENIQRLLADRDSFAEPFGEQKFIAPKGGKKKKKAKEKRDPLDKYRTRFENEFVQSEQAQHDLNDLVNGEDTIFDEEAARAEAEKIAAQTKDEASLKSLIAKEHERQLEIKKSIEVQKAIISINDKKAETEANVSEDLEDLKTGYESINLASKHYVESLEREYRTEIQIAESRMKRGDATEFEINQYIKLKKAIDAAVRAKEAELVVAAAKEAKGANEEYDASFRSSRQQANFLGEREMAKWQEALAKAIELRDNAKQIDQDLLDAEDQLADKRAAAAMAAERHDDASKNAAEEEIRVIGARIDGLNVEKQAASETIPYIERRIAILREEDAIRNKWGGAAGPLYDWAKTASTDFKDLGNSMGNVLVNSMDEFINSLGQGKMAFADFAKSILKGLLMIIIRGLIAKAIMSALGLPGGFSGTGGGLGPSVYPVVGGVDPLAPTGHSGMVVGGTSPMYKSVNPAIFSFAERYHSGGLVGLRSDEIPIIAQKGEGVFTKEQMKAMGQTNSGPPVQVNVINQTGVQADVERGQPKFDGEKYVETIILKKIATAGPVRDALTMATRRK